MTGLVVVLLVFFIGTSVLYLLTDGHPDAWKRARRRSVTLALAGASRPPAVPVMSGKTRL